eukprot:TRINITY_DN5180_c0_g1_i1.p1 TRINITY_DN5180_c0_g1~~TRINITY_DN5180_c0_g1_i1.p1  ORF type:complete len:1377 (-),score=356.53 TRINITY_DN5180_c0_g1_i1:83-4213(-)
MATTEKESTTSSRAPNAANATNWLSRLLFSYVTPLLRIGWTRPLNDSDLWELDQEDESNNLHDRLEKEWANEHRIRPEKPSLFRTLLRMFWVPLTISWIFQAFSSAANLATTQVLNRLIIYLRLYAFYNDNGREGYLWAMAICLLAVIRSIAQYQSQIRSMRVGIQIRAVLMTKVYRKSLHVTAASRKEWSTGQVVNLMSNDTTRMLEMFQFLNEGLFALPNIAICLALLYQQLGPYVFAGFTVVFLTMPINILSTSRMTAARRLMIDATDQRAKTVNEALQSIKVIKFYAWEESFHKRITEARDEELKHLRTFSNWRALVSASISMVPQLMSLVCFVTYVAGGGSDGNGTLPSSVVFTSIALFNLIRLPLTLLPILLAMLAQLTVSLDRMTGYLQCEEVNPDADRSPAVKVVDTEIDTGATTAATAGSTEFAGLGPQDQPAVMAKPTFDLSAEMYRVPDDDTQAPLSMVGVHRPKQPSSEPLLSIRNGEYKYDKDGKVVMKNVNLSVSKGQLVMVVGAVGSGKSTFVQSVMGETVQSGGTRHVAGTTAYAPQQAWIVNETLRDNILFGQPFDDRKYKAVIEACALRSDIEMLPGGDMTEIGERGVNVSGGQKQRISIARAVYSQADIVVLDDPLSAVDAHVAQHLFFQCFRGPLKSKAVVLVANQLQFLPHADYIIVLKDGAVSESGTYQQLIAQKRDFAELIAEYVSGQTDDEAPEAALQTLSYLPGSIRAPGSVTAQRSGDRRLADKQIEKAKAAQLIAAEDREQGMVPLSLYWRYFASPGSILLFLLTILIWMSENTAYGLSQVWLNLWSNYNGPTDYSFQQKLLGVYGGLSGANAILSLIRSMMFVVFSVAASRALHAKLLTGVLRYPTSFFDTNPLGRVINRFTKDIDFIDLLLPQSMQVVLVTGFVMCTAVAVASSFQPIILAVLGPLVIIFYFIAYFYRHSSVELQRLESLSRSPIFASFSEVLTGVSSIRAYHAQPRFAAKNSAQVNQNTRAYLTLQVANQWLGVRLDSLCYILVYLASTFLVIFRDNPSISNPLSSGLILTNILTVMNFLNRTAIQYTDTETKMSAVERVEEYAALPEEAPAITDVRPPVHWPSRGEIIFENVYMRYRPGLPYVVKDISLTFDAGKKVGVVGRTGAGKSSVMLLLFRIVELAQGNIHVDGVNISQIGLKDLRSRLAIIPQEPALFSGTVRSNLDPFGEYKDDAVIETLQQIQLHELVMNDPLQLLMKVTEDGDNFSVGQRQLICLGRALLRKPKILLMDEATASVDVETDAQIQRTVRSSFAECTIITIAHRLNTIMDYDKVLVLDQGCLVEYDTPANLLKIDNGYFTGLVESTGKETEAYLRAVANGKASALDMPAELIAAEPEM